MEKGKKHGPASRLPRAQAFGQIDVFVYQLCTPWQNSHNALLASSMSSTLAKYETFLVKNVSTISSLESSLRSITWFLPGRFKDADLVSETCQSYTTTTNVCRE